MKVQDQIQEQVDNTLFEKLQSNIQYLSRLLPYKSNRKDMTVELYLKKQSEKKTLPIINLHSMSQLIVQLVYLIFKCYHTGNIVLKLSKNIHIKKNNTVYLQYSVRNLNEEELSNENQKALNRKQNSSEDDSKFIPQMQIENEKPQSDDDSQGSILQELKQKNYIKIVCHNNSGNFYFTIKRLLNRYFQYFQYFQIEQNQKKKKAYQFYQKKYFTQQNEALCSFLRNFNDNTTRSMTGLMESFECNILFKKYSHILKITMLTETIQLFSNSEKIKELKGYINSNKSMHLFDILQTLGGRFTATEIIYTQSIRDVKELIKCFTEFRKQIQSIMKQDFDKSIKSEDSNSKSGENSSEEIEENNQEIRENNEKAEENKKKQQEIQLQMLEQKEEQNEYLNPNKAKITDIKILEYHLFPSIQNDTTDEFGQRMPQNQPLLIEVFLRLEVLQAKYQYVTSSLFIKLKTDHSIVKEDLQKLQQLWLTLGEKAYHYQISTYKDASQSNPDKVPLNSIDQEKDKEMIQISTQITDFSYKQFHMSVISNVDRMIIMYFEGKYVFDYFLKLKERLLDKFIEEDIIFKQRDINQRRIKHLFDIYEHILIGVKGKLTKQMEN